MKKYFFFYITIVTICVTLFSSCKEPVTDVTLNKNELTLVPGETETLIAIVHPADASNDKVAWKSSNSEVATVDDSGMVTAVTNGKAIITVTTQDGRKKATCEVTVDFRSQWVGDWEFVVYPSTNYLGYISYGEQNNVICIKYMQQMPLISVKINECGDLVETVPRDLYIFGKFEGKYKVHFVLIDHSMGGPNFELTVDGIKKEGGNK